MLFKLSIKNIKKSMKDYAIYFMTLILGVAIFYVFNAIESQTVMLNVTKSTAEIIKLMTNMLSGVSVFVSIILGFLIIYASRFLIKRRNKEFGIYLTLGMSKRKISLILFFETLLIGIISLIVGILVGTVLSQFMSILVANLFDADMTKFKFIFSTASFIKTLIYFGIMYLLVMIFNTINISKCKLIDLLHGNKKEEKIKLKNPVFCTVVFIVAVLLLSYAYYLVTGGIEKLQDVNEIFIPIGLGIISTFLIFFSLSGLLLKIVGSMKKVYYKGLNSFTLRQISSKVNTTVFSMSIICLMLFVTICVLSSCLSLKNSMSSNIKDLAPIDLELVKRKNLTEIDTKSNKVIEDSKISIKKTLENNNFSVNENLKDITVVNLYETPGLTLKVFFGTTLKKVQEKYPYLRYESTEDIMKLSDYNKVAKLYGNKNYTLNDNEYMIIADFDSMIELRNEVLKEKEAININNNNLTPKYTKCKNGFLDLAANHINSGLIIVPDKVITTDMVSKEILLANYKKTSKEERYKLDEELSNMTEKNWDVTTQLTFDSKIEITEASIGLGALVTFIGLYLGVIFLISSAAILALKELSESTDNKERFMMLRRLGADEKMINKALFRQIAIFFMTPLILAIIHSIFGIKFATYILETFGTSGLMPSIIMTIIFLIVIYGGYFLLTYICSKNIIKER